MLTERQQECIDVIRRHIDVFGYPPTLREIGDAMQIRSTNGVNDHLRALERKGFIWRDDKKSRAITLTDVAQAAEANRQTPGTFIKRMRCLVCAAVTFTTSCAVCGKDLLEVMAA